MPSAFLSDTVSRVIEDERKPTLLVVDDEAGPRQSLKVVFRNDYEILLASSGEEALEIAREHPIDVAVLDIMMEGMSGTQLLSHLKQLDATIEVVMLTAYETIDTARQALRHGACDYLNKPFDIPTMRAAVARASAKHRIAVNLNQTNQTLQRLQREIRDQKVQKEVIRGQGEIYASVLHDINSPLTIISGFVEMINYSIENVASLEGDRLESVRDDLQKLTQQVSRCFEISRRYLSFLHSNSTEVAKVSITQILSDLRELLIRHPDAQGNHLEIETPQNNLVGQINGTDLLQILLNLTINAFQCSDLPHRVEVSCRILTETPDVKSFKNSDHSRVINVEGLDTDPPFAAITVSDNGPGMAPELVAKMFQERFSTKSAEQGTGLGFSIIRRLVESANAALVMETTHGEGTEFTLFVQVSNATR